MQESTRLRLEGNWEQWKGRLRKTWGDLTDDDLDRVQGNTQELVGLIKERTGESAQQIEDRLDRLAREER